MTLSFNENITLDTSRVNRGRRGAAIGGGISGVSIIGAIIVFALTGQLPDFNQLMGDTGGFQTGSKTQYVSQCTTGVDANNHPECRMIAGTNSLDAFWGEQLPAEAGVANQQPYLTLYNGTTTTACGTGTSQMGPFYCPADQTIYMDVSFFNELESMGAQNTSLAQLYIIAHEYGHHIQNQLGILNRIDHNDLGENSAMVRSELQADCLAGTWIAHAAGTIDPDTGIAFMKQPTQEELSSALAAAQSVGDDKIYENAGMQANPDTFSHGSAANRQKWLTRGMQGGTIASCDTWSPATL